MSTLEADVWDDSGPVEPMGDRLKTARGLTMEESNLLVSIVKHRVGVEDKKSKIKLYEEELKQAKTVWLQNELRLNTAIGNAKICLQYDEEELLIAEDSLRRKIVDGLLVGRVPKEPVAEEQQSQAEPVETREDLGRAE